jgi:L-malate glycosyltransferase
MAPVYNEKEIRIVHVTSHLGGGVGKAISALVTSKSSLNTKHQIICLEQPINTIFYEKILKNNVQIHITRDPKKISGILDSADILQIEWWSHPLMCDFIFKNAITFHGRLAVWFHQSGLFTPLLPSTLFEHSNALILTSECSLAADNILRLDKDIKEKISVISSACELENLPKTRSHHVDRAGLMKAAYAGTLNFSKLHPKFGEWVGASREALCRLDIYGDRINQNIILSNLYESEANFVTKFHGFIDNLYEQLTTSNVFIYLLNPLHYGTAENALVEAMAAGLLPVVLDNPAERAIVDNGQTGIVLSDISQLPSELIALCQDTERSEYLSLNAQNYARSRFTTKKMRQNFDEQYQKLMESEPKIIEFNAFGELSPLEQFLITQPENGFFKSEASSYRMNEVEAFGLVDKTKGSIFQFISYFPGDEGLLSLANSVTESLRNEEYNNVEIPEF